MSEDSATPPPIPRGQQRAREQQRAAWALVGALVLVLGGLALWSQRLAPARPPSPEEGRDGGAHPLPGYAADGSATPAPPEPVAFGLERCSPWHVSAAEAPPSPGFRLLVLTSPLSDPEGFALSGLGEGCARNLQVLRAEGLAPGELRDLLARAAPPLDAVVALGPTPLALARSEAPGLPLLHALIPNPVEAGLDRPDVAGVSPWVPMGPLARHVHTLLPGSKARVLVLFPEAFRPQAEAASRALAALGRRVELAPLASPEALPGVLTTAAARADAWLALPDRRLLGPEAFDQLQGAAERAGLPLCVSDEEHVKDGAFVGAATDLHRIGAQLCRLAGALERGRLPATGRVFCPEYTFAAVNEAVVQKLGYILDPAQLLQAKVIQWH